MTPERYARVRAIFDEAASLPPDRRPAHVRARAGPDADLAREVEALLDRADGSSPVDGRVAVPPTLLRAGEPRPGSSSLTVDVGGGSGAGEPPPGEPTPGNGAGPFPEVAGYRVTGRLGEGGMGVVWRAVQLSTNRPVALKLMGAASLGSPRARARFAREVELAAALQHPGVARVYDSGVREGVYYYAMELVDGLPLDRFVEGRGLGVRATLALVRDVCRAVQYAHQRGVIHRDLKPSNVLVSADGQPHVLDFGLAKAAAGDGAAAAAATVSLAGEVAGTPAYMSPEQAAGLNELVDTRSDVYALGVIAYRLLTGQFPHEASGSHLDVLRRVAEAEPTPPRTARPDLDREVDAILLKALARETDDRYQSAVALAEDITRYLDGEPVEARPHSLTYVLGKRLRKNRGRVAAAMAVAGLILATCVGAYVRVVAERNQAERHRARAEDERVNADAQAARATQAAAREQDARHRLEAQQAETQRAKERAEAARAEARLEAYVANLTAAEAGWSAGEFGTARARLRAAPEEHRGWEWRLLDALTDRSVAAFDAHGATVNALASAAADGGRWLASGGDDRMVRIWDLGGARWGEVAALGPEDGPVTAVGMSPDARVLVSGTARGTITLWDVVARRAIGRLPPHGAKINSLAFSADGAYVGSASQGLARVLDAKRGDVVRQFESDVAVFAVAFSRTGDSFAYTSGKGQLCVIDSLASSAAPGRVVTDNVSFLRGLAFLPGGTDLIVGTSRSDLLLRTAEGVSRVAPLRNEIAGLSLHPDGHRVVVAGADDTVEVLNLEDPDGPPLMLRGHEGAIRAVTYARRGSLIASASNDGTIRLWPAAAPEDVSKLEGHSEGVNDVAFSPDGRQLVTGSDDGTVRVWDASTARQVASFKLPPKYVHSVAFSPDGSTVTASRTERVITWDLATGQRTRTLIAPHTVSRFAISADGSKLAAAAFGGSVTMWDLTRGNRQTEYRRVAHGGPDCRDVAFSPDGRRLVSTWGDGHLAVHDVNRFDQPVLVQPHKGIVRCVRFSQDGSKFATGAEDRTIKLWDAAANVEVRRLAGHAGAVNDVVFTPDGTRLVSAGNDKTVRVWDVQSGHELIRFKTEGSARALAFNVDGTRLAFATAKPVVHVFHSVTTAVRFRERAAGAPATRP